MAIILLFFLLLTKFSKTNSQQQNNQISLASSLSAGTNNSFWLSDSGKFAFGFYQASNGSFSVGIWLEKIKEKTVIWTWNRDDKPQPRETTLRLSGDGRLVLRDAQGMEILVYSNTSQPATSASMLDSGNFVLYSLDSKIIWQSFDYPTDTLLPEQRLEAGEQLVSSVSTTNHSSGRFQLRMQRDGNLVQYPTDSRILSFYSYWASDTYDKGNGVSLNLDIKGQMEYYGCILIVWFRTAAGLSSGIPSKVSALLLDFVALIPIAFLAMMTNLIVNVFLALISSISARGV